MHVFCKVSFIISLLTIQATFIAYGQDITQQTRSNRKKRFLIFPKGTVIQLVYCYLMSALGTEGIFTVGATLGTNWDVPVDLEKLVYDDKMKIQSNRREKRSLYPRIEYMLNQYPGLPEGWYEPVDEYDYMLDQCADTKYDDEACVVR